MAYLLGEPTVQQYFDANGDPLANGTIEFYIWNTSTPTAVYSDSTGTSLGTSVTLNSIGAPQSGGGTAVALFFDSSVTYKIIRKDSGGVAIDPTIGPYKVIPDISQQSVDDLSELQGATTSSFSGGEIRYMKGRTSVGDGGEGTFIWRTGDKSTEVAADEVTSSSGDGGVWIAPSSDLTGASGAWERLYSGSLNVQWYGAVPDFDGVDTGTDSYPAMKAAFSYANTITTDKTSVSSVFAPAGQYLASPTAPITGFSGLAFYGEMFTQFTTGQDSQGTRIYCDTDIPLFKVGNSALSTYSPSASSTRSNSIYFKDFSVTGRPGFVATAEYTTACIELWNCSEVRMLNVQMKREGHACVYGEDSFDGRFENCLFDGGEPDGVAAFELVNGNDNTNSNVMLNCRLETTSGPMLKMTGNNNRIIGTKFHGDCNQSHTDRHTITNAADNGSGEIRITATGHGRTTGDYVYVSRVNGTTEANGLWQVTVIDANNYDLDGSTFTNAYTSGGLGLKVIQITGAADNGSGLIRITAPSHGLSDNDTVGIADVAGTTEANDHWQISLVDANTFDLYGSTFTNAYTSGGWVIETTVAAVTVTSGAVIGTGCQITNFNASLVNKTKAIVHASSANAIKVTGNIFYANESDESNEPDCPNILVTGSTISGSIPTHVGPNTALNQPLVTVHNRVSASSDQIYVQWPDVKGLRNDSVGSGLKAWESYNEGTWTPTYEPTSGAFGGITYDSATGGIWKRVGNKVTISGYIRTDSVTVGTASGLLYIGFNDLPFTIKNTGSNAGWGVSAVFSSSFATNHPDHLQATDGDNKMSLRYRASAGGASANVNVADMATGANSNIVAFQMEFDIEQ